MVFNSAAFAIFLPTVLVLFFVAPKRLRPILILAASMFFYAYFVPAYILVLFFLITLDFLLAMAIARSTGTRRKILLIVSIAANLGTLFFFKYLDFFNTNVSALASLIHWNYAPAALNLLLPIGLSFHVFQSLSYVIEVYRGKYRPEKDYPTYALYVMFFPQLMAGPIERPGHLLPQLALDRPFDPVRARRGFERILWGFFKKLVIADNLATVIDPLWKHLPTDGPSLIVLACLFTYQLYADFSGYSDIAVGTALVMGVDLTENFNRPFAATSIAEFWRRWHISLSSWLRDYIYYPLAFAGARVTKARLYLSLFVTFVLIGLWHGAAWTFVVMGALHGAYLVAGVLTQEARLAFWDRLRVPRTSAVHRAFKIVVSFLLVSLSFVFFRAPSMGQAVYFVRHMFDNFTLLATPEYLGHVFLRNAGFFQFATFLAVGSIILMEILQYAQARKGTFHVLEGSPALIRHSAYYALALVIVLFGYFGAQNFIYFQF